MSFNLVSVFFYCHNTCFSDGINGAFQKGFQGWFALNQKATQALRAYSVGAAAVWGMMSVELPTLVKVIYKTMFIFHQKPECYGFNEANESSQKAPVLLLHGAAGSWNYMGDLAASLKSSGRDVFVLDLGFEGATDSSIEKVCQKIAEVKTKTRFSEVDIVAHSMGGAVAYSVLNSDQNEVTSIGRVVTLALPFDFEEKSNLESKKIWDKCYHVTAQYDLVIGHKEIAAKSNRVQQIATTHVEIVYDAKAQEAAIKFLDSDRDHSCLKSQERFERVASEKMNR